MEIRQLTTKSGNVYRFVNEFESTRTGFNHKTTMFRWNYDYEPVKCHYINRTWEMFTYQTSMLKAIDTIYDKELYDFIERYKENNNISKFKKGEKDKVIESFNETETGKDLLELRDAIKYRNFKNEF